MNLKNAMEPLGFKASATDAKVKQDVQMQVIDAMQAMCVTYDTVGGCTSTLLHFMGRG